MHPQIENQLKCYWEKLYIYIYIFLKILFIFRERGREGEREGEKHQCVVANCMSPTGDLALQPRHVP